MLFIMSIKYVHDNIEHDTLLQASGDVIQKNTITELVLLSII